ncbi:MAG: HDOD domain-containing protein [Gammaproteobacteria bacterium]|uniref:EAL and modified HD-GYP domain-containing signal transduction protein n=1 Tax=Marinomonas polaris DSM 16579 TaxID=1122206 RepID=A0A1M5J2X7_9GAMM|nr:MULTISPECIES: HDOD domain-containing protein [Marinomonas]MBU1293920.1 HDOD domain-containing protein [Gammaproteobacteria bacterium]MBU1466299.1 HDOD domain-containing protein [Gammaproteobacteria bacterium]MBU2021692.1 HDOD domain-containing protein [Gammaproteobacteria bacterium]MBU2240475.1 HDOD domain-containing protein [Gammaproteobacteria bacterium]MBU2320304.1 HDOD domain-containing protein [Gammaproteobacteria bacterium]|tara:strand:+ start:5269 stop:6495 length:1227 start_codon:yes stop_codon:yes gene_type:complete
MIEFPTVLDDLMMAQQPILKKTKEIFGYELLFRGKDSLNANIADGETATSQVLVNLCIGITKLESQLRKPFFINMTTDLMLSDAFFPIDPDTVYIEILEKQKLTPEFFAALKKWRSAGYRFALDDYQFDIDYQALLPWVSIVKIDVLATPPEQHLAQIAELKSRGLILLAEKVEDLAMFELCKKLGFDLFQGYFLQRPELIKGKRIDSAIHGAIELVNALQNKDISIEAIADLVTKNPKLSYQLLRILNSPICGVYKTVVSIKEAVIFLGLVQLKKWALLITLTSSTNQPKALLKVLLTRARCCQLLAESKKSPLADSAFMVGLMSGIDAVFNVEKTVALEQIALDKNALDAIMNQTGELGSYLTQTLSCEEQDWDNIHSLSPAERTILNRAFLDAMLWSEEVMQSIN